MLNLMEKFWLVFGQSDGWVVHTNYEEALADYSSILLDSEQARLLEVNSLKELKSQE